MTIIKMMLKNWTKSIFILLLLSITTFATDPSSTDLQLIDLTALLGSLNLTYADLGINPANLTSMARAAASSNSEQTPVSTDKIEPTPNNPTISQAQNTISPSTTTASNPTSSGQTSSNSVSKSNTKDIQSTNTNKLAPTDSGKNSLPTNLPNKQLTVSSQSTKNNDMSSVKNTETSSTPKVVTPPSSTSTNSPSTSKYSPTPSTSSTAPSSSSQTSSLSGSSSTQSSNANVNSPPVIGPGPTDPNLPPVLDFSKMVVSTNLLTPSASTVAPTTSAQISTPTPAPSSTSTSGQSSSQISSNQSGSTLISSATNSNSKNTSPDILSKSSDSQTQTSIQSIYTPPTPKVEQPKQTQNSQPKVPVTNNPIPTPIVKPTTQTPSPVVVSQSVQIINTVPSVITITADASSSQSVAGQYQYFSASQDAIYNLSASYKSFLNYFIISVNDPLLPKLQEYLFSNYGNYLNRGELIVGLRLYNSDGTLDYQLLYNTNYGTFTSIMTVQPDNVRIQLKTLSILNFFIMQIDYPNCQQQNAQQKNCKVCKQNYRNFMGRCKPYDQYCVKYSAEECISCSRGKVLVSGYCQ